MESNKSNVELIDKFIENEHKSKLWTIISVSLDIIIAVGLRVQVPVGVVSVRHRTKDRA